jgi:hypothetical protein
MISKYDIAANVALECLEGFEGTMNASVQKRIFGRNVFGKKTIHIDASNQGRVFGSFKVCFGTDFVEFDMSFDQIAFLTNNPTVSVIW